MDDYSKTPSKVILHDLLEYTYTNSAAGFRFIAYSFYKIPMFLTLRIRNPSAKWRCWYFCAHILSFSYI